jgi:hypothetical protein
MSKLNKLGLVGLAVLAVSAFVGASSASAAQWLDNGNAIGAASLTTIVDDGNGLTLTHTGGLFGNHTLTCSGSSTGSATNPTSVGPGAADSNGTVVVTGCTNVLSCTNPAAAALNTPWTTGLASTTVDNITAGTGGNAGWRATCSGVSVNCLKATTPVNVSNDTSVTPNRVNGVFTTGNTSTTCADGGTGTVAGTVWITLNNGHNLSVGP